MTSPTLRNLHVDYAQGSENECEYDCQQTASEREYYDALTPLQYMHYSEQEAAVLGEKLKDKKTFQQAVFILNTWLERGECHSYNVDLFYLMIQSINNYVMRLMNEKLKYQYEYNEVKLMLIKRNRGIFLQLNEILKAFKTVSLQKVWDHFTKAQRKNIELWKKQTEEIKNAHVKEFERSDLDEGASEKASDTSDQKNKLEKELFKLKRENEIIRCQLEAAVNETAVLRSETAQALELKEHCIQDLMQVLQRPINVLNQKHVADIKDLGTFKSQRIMNKDDYQDGNKDHYEIDMCQVSSSCSDTNICESEARLLSLISIFLHMHHFGANIDYICSYLNQILSTIQQRDVESLMKRFPTIYREDSIGIGASLKKKWRFLGLEL